MHRLLLLVPLLCLTFLVKHGSGHLIDGIFTEPTLEPGYNLVATVPRGALALNVTELRHTQNYLAIRLQNGSYLLNGNYTINWSGEYKAAGTTFVYLRQSAQNLESFSAAGPLQESVDVMVLYQEPNPGIVYRYIIPGSVNVPASSYYAHNAVASKGADPAPPASSYRKTNGTGPSMIDGMAPPHIQRRYKKRKFAWKSTTHTECSKSCGGGVQTLRYICIREHNQAQVPDKRCHAIEKPKEIQVKCNTVPCPPIWRGGPWSECSVSCGTGVRTREAECVQEVRPSLTIRISNGACMEPNTISTNEVCTMPSCRDDVGTTLSTSTRSQWNVGPWSQCSASCGPGKRTRTVTCHSYGYPCPAEEKPSMEEACDLGLCPVNAATANAVSARLQGPQWLYTEWSDQCSAECGTGVQTRHVFCDSDKDGGYCAQENRPDTSRACSSNRTCSGQWFTGPWTECSAMCDLGEQVREVVCVTTLRGALRVVLDMNCPANKPELRKPCRGPPCTSTWFVSDWTECSRSCGKGVQKREVRCLTPEGLPPEPHQSHCNDEARPAFRRTCNDYPCKDDLHGDSSYRTLQIQNDPEISNGLEENAHCKDKLTNCNAVAQARLCSYQFYQRSCCFSCSRAKHELE